MMDYIITDLENTKLLIFYAKTLQFVVYFKRFV